jgi:hypothetical protein
MNGGSVQLAILLLLPLLFNISAAQTGCHPSKGYKIKVELKILDPDFCSNVSDNFTLNALYNSLEQRDIANCTVVPPKVLGYECKQKKLKSKTKGTKDDETTYSINALVMCDSCTPGSVDIPDKVKYEKTKMKSKMTGVDELRVRKKLGIATDERDIQIDMNLFSVKIKDEKFQGFYCNCELVPAGTQGATCECPHQCRLRG